MTTRTVLFTAILAFATGATLQAHAQSADGYRDAGQSERDVRGRDGIDGPARDTATRTEYRGAAPAAPQPAKKQPMQGKRDVPAREGRDGHDGPARDTSIRTEYPGTAHAPPKPAKKQPVRGRTQGTRYGKDDVEPSIQRHD